MKNSEVPMKALRRAVRICGGLDALGDKLNVSTATRQGKGTPDSNEGGRKGPRQ